MDGWMEQRGKDSGGLGAKVKDTGTKWNDGEVEETEITREGGGVTVRVLVRRGRRERRRRRKRRRRRRRRKMGR